MQVAVLRYRRVNEYAEQVASSYEAGFRVETNLRSEKIGAKIRTPKCRVPLCWAAGDREQDKAGRSRERVSGDSV